MYLFLIQNESLLDDWSIENMLDILIGQELSES